jgi:hypothetical protein
MPSFPALEPLSRQWAFPDYPSLAHETFAWGDVVFEYGQQPTETFLELVYTLLSEAEMKLLRDHYRNQQQVHPFYLPAAIWAGYQNIGEAEAFLPISGQWLYDGELEEDPVAPGLYDCTVKLVSLPEA